MSVPVQACLDDPHLIATCALRLAALYRDRGDFLLAVQVLRSATARVQLHRDAATAQQVFDPSQRPDDQLALSHSSVSAHFPITTASEVEKRPGAGAYAGAGLFGSGSQVRWTLGRRVGAVVGCSCCRITIGSWPWWRIELSHRLADDWRRCCEQVWTDDQSLACLHYDLLALTFACELALSASQNTAKKESTAARTAHASAKAAAAIEASKSPMGESVVTVLSSSG